MRMFFADLFAVRDHWEWSRVLTGGGMKHFIFFTIFLLNGQALRAQDWARAQVEKSPRHNEWVTIKHDSRSEEAFVVYPASKDKVPVVLIIHENTGVTDWVQAEAVQIAEAGYIAVVPDLLSSAGPNGGRTTTTPNQDKPAEALTSVSPGQIISDLDAAADYALKLSGTSGQLFVLGFDWGAGQAFQFAASRPDLTAVCAFYGPAPDKDVIVRIKAPIYAFYARNDEHIDATVSEMKSITAGAGMTFQPVIYDGADHGFMRIGEAPDATEPNKIARHEAKERLEIILRKITVRGYF
jgi:carboxymethylenebutenolidase